MLAVGLWRQKGERVSERASGREGGMDLSFMRLPKPLRFLVAHSLLTRAPAVRLEVKLCALHNRGHPMDGRIDGWMMDAPFFILGSFIIRLGMRLCGVTL